MLSQIKVDSSFKILMLGVGGIGVSALARFYRGKGASVYGCDEKLTPLLKDLQDEGIIIIPENQVYASEFNLIIYTNAISKNHPVLQNAIKENILILKRGTALAYELSNKHSVAVTGSHGKTTITFLVGNILQKAGELACVYGGGIDIQEKTNLILGDGKWFVAELDESDKTFLDAKPHITVISNVDFEHVDQYKNFKEQQKCFIDFIKNLPDYSILIINGDDQFLKDSAETYFKGRSLIMCGYKDYNDYIIKSFSQQTTDLVSLEIEQKGSVNEFIINLKGEHNFYNFVFSLAVFKSIGVSNSSIQEVMRTFKNVERRMEQICILPNQGRLISDYGHHPTEIASVLKSLKITDPTSKIVAIFEGHRISRVNYFIDQFIDALKIADQVLLADFYKANEKGSSEEVIIQLQKGLKDCSCEIIANTRLVKFIHNQYRNGEVVIYFSAGPLDSVIRAGVKNLNV